MQERLSFNQFQRPIYIESREESNDEEGDIHAVVDYPLVTVSSALREATHWCDILILHLNVKYCRASTDQRQRYVSLQIGRKYGEPLDTTRRVAFAHSVVTDEADYFQTMLTAEKGPFSTANYTIMLEAVPVEGGRTFVHLSYSYTFGLPARLAMKAYLNTLGDGKVGFTIIDTDANSKPVYVNDFRGLLERNTMRFYLAVDAYLSALASPPQEQLDKRLREWFAATERFPLQLHEVDQAEYLAMKREEYHRQQLEP